MEFEQGQVVLNDYFSYLYIYGWSWKVPFVGSLLPRQSSPGWHDRCKRQCGGVRLGGRRVFLAWEVFSSPVGGHLARAHFQQGHRSNASGHPSGSGQIWRPCTPLNGQWSQLMYALSPGTWKNMVIDIFSVCSCLEVSWTLLPHHVVKGTASKPWWVW